MIKNCNCSIFNRLTSPQWLLSLFRPNCAQIFCNLLCKVFNTCWYIAAIEKKTEKVQKIKNPLPLNRKSV